MLWQINHKRYSTSKSLYFRQMQIPIDVTEIDGVLFPICLFKKREYRDHFAYNWLSPQRQTFSRITPSLYTFSIDHVFTLYILHRIPLQYNLSCRNTFHFIYSYRITSSIYTFFADQTFTLYTLLRSSLHFQYTAFYN